MAEQTSQIVVQPVNKEKVKKLLIVALYLFIVTAIEFVIAFTMEAGPLRTSIFIGLTIVKAYYIVSEFMHLKYEVKMLIWSIIIPMIFVVWLVTALIYEGGAIFDVRY